MAAPQRCGTILLLQSVCPMHVGRVSLNRCCIAGCARFRELLNLETALWFATRGRFSAPEFCAKSHPQNVSPRRAPRPDFRQRRCQKMRLRGATFWHRNLSRFSVLKIDPLLGRSLAGLYRGHFSVPKTGPFFGPKNWTVFRRRAATKMGSAACLNLHRRS